ncbi:MAG TPA: 2-dehydropantoate 2-reductase, partial [Chitinophagaceae bacterium]
MNKNTRILIAGIGGVGGYYGGLLAKHHHHTDSEILFLSRGENLEAIRQKGLLIKEGEQQFRAYPSQIISDAADAGTVDYLIMAPKRYDLEEMMEQLSPAVHPGTIILPLLNGIDAAAVIQKRFPGNKV